MSGIFGIVQFDGSQVDPAALECMRGAMSHRGPDGSNVWMSDGVGLGQMMLCSTPESLNEALPWKDPESGLVITADARIDNREELLSKLSVRGRHAAEIPDSQIILAAYKRWGNPCVDHLLGDFAFAIWDARNKILFCARDHMGIRPFYYYRTEKLFVFASSALGVVAASQVPKRICELRIADFLIQDLEGVDKTCTWFEDVWRMPPAHFGTLSAGGFSQREYWQPDAETELVLASDDEYTDAFEEVLLTAVRARMRSHKAPASMLSGGVDSSVIVSLARQLSGATDGSLFATYSGVSELGDDCRESRFSRIVIEQGGLDASLLRPSDVARYEGGLCQLDRVSEDPFDMHWTHHRMVYLAARERDNIAVMDGIDGDGVASLTSLYPAYLFRAGLLLAAHREIFGKWKHYHRRTVSLWADYAAMLRLVLVPGFARKLKKMVIRSDVVEAETMALIHPEFIARTALDSRIVDFQQRVGLGPVKSTTLRQAHASRIIMPYLTAGIERYGRIAAACGVEQRQPFLDRRVIDHCLSLPWQQKCRNGWSKFGLRRLAERTLPATVAWRTGWDSILWKFWHSRAEQNRVQILDRIGGDTRLCQQLLIKEKFEQLLIAVKIGEVDAMETVCHLDNLLTWLQNHGESGDWV